MSDWRPDGWGVVTLKKGQTCILCKRALFKGDTNFIKKVGRRWRFRCADRRDCMAVKEHGGEPAWRRAAAKQYG